MTKKNNHKYIFVLGGVMSGIGKGIATSSIGKILQASGFRINLIKIDPYLNVDAGTMNPTEHGEVFVLDSGLESDQDMGNYERFTGITSTNDDYITSGMVYKYVIEKERNLGYKGKCVEAIPDIVNEIVRRIKLSEQEDRSDISIIEVGGTIGDYQNTMFIEAGRILKLKNPKNVLFILVSHLPVPAKVGEMKTRPTRIASQTLNSYGVQADFIIARSSVKLDKKRKEKLATSCNIPEKNIISAPDIESIYDVPINFELDKLGSKLLKSLGLKALNGIDLKEWKNFVLKSKNAKKKLNIAIAGKYFGTGNFILSDSYISVIEAIKFSSYNLGIRPVLTWLNSKDFDRATRKPSSLKKFDGIIVPGGFGESGVGGKMNIIKYARENGIPFLGLCYGMQLAVVEYARNVLEIKNANTVEIDPNTADPVIDIMPEQKKKLEKNDYGGTMRLGSYPAILKEGTIVRKIYGVDKVNERHRHRYEINPEYIQKLEEGGIIFSGKSPNGRLMEIMELSSKDHPFFVATQFHPEFKAQPLLPHPLFTGFIKACINKK
ncbi:CTP synthase [Patescibacteria group bacterium]|nr:CTP synthase [Patescibacteria group bacterium]MBU4057452.1 CTP synthase [Patescibacteria group bacterium]MBU4115929.1 CTP synthase [Patescibacteria group bacterium]